MGEMLVLKKVCEKCGLPALVCVACGRKKRIQEGKERKESKIRKRGNAVGDDKKIKQ